MGTQGYLGRHCPQALGFRRENAIDRNQLRVGASWLTEAGHRSPEGRTVVPAARPSLSATYARENGSSTVPWNQAIPLAPMGSIAADVALGPGIGSGLLLLQPSAITEARPTKAATHSVLTGKLLLPFDPATLA